MLPSPIPSPRLPRCFSALLALVVLGSGPLRAQERGWGDTWTEPRSDGARSTQKALAQIVQEVQAKHFEAAEAQINALVRRSPEAPDVRLWRARIHAGMKRYEAALRDCAEAFDLVKSQEPNALGQVYLERAVIYQAMGRARDARADLEHAVRIDKTNAQFNNDLAWFLATSPETGVRDGQLAVRYAKAANQLIGSHDPALLDTLAAAEAEAGDFASAAKHEREALARAKGDKLHGADQRLRLYENHQPYREHSKHDSSE